MDVGLNSKKTMAFFFIIPEMKTTFHGLFSSERTTGGHLVGNLIDSVELEGDLHIC